MQFLCSRLFLHFHILYASKLSLTQLQSTPQFADKNHLIFPPFQVVPILRTGLALAEHASSMLPATKTYHIGKNKVSFVQKPTPIGGYRSTILAYVPGNIQSIYAEVCIYICTFCHVVHLINVVLFKLHLILILIVLM